MNPFKTSLALLSGSGVWMAWCWDVAWSNKGKLFLELPLWEPVLLFSMVLLLEVIERRQLDFPSSHLCVWVCVHMLLLSDISLVIPLCRVCVCACVFAVIQAYLQPCGLAADCSLKVTTHDLWGPGQISVLGCCCLSLPSIPIYTPDNFPSTRACTTSPLGKETYT